MDDNYLVLIATEENWGLIGPGDWTKVVWNIFSDGYYEKIVYFYPTDYDDEFLKKHHIRKKQKKNTGRMKLKSIKKLCKELSREPWRDPTIEIDACDGVAWQIESYNEDGSIDKTSGDVDYIYGHIILENIVSLLPDDEDYYDSSAFVSVGKKLGRL